jgi:hypothetical protein
VNTTLGNVKAALTGTYRRISPEHAGRYLGSFAWRHNRRFQLATLIPRLVHSAVRTAPLGAVAKDVEIGVASPSAG